MKLLLTLFSFLGILRHESFHDLIAYFKFFSSVKKCINSEKYEIQVDDEVRFY